MKKKWIAWLLAGLLLVCASGAMAEEATVLPLGLHFDMDAEAVRTALGGSAAEDFWEDGGGVFMLESCPIGIGAIQADYISCQIDLFNGARMPGLSSISIDLPIGEKCVASFRQALNELTIQYGEPDSDPFSPDAAAAYVEYGNLSASWTKSDARVSLTLNRTPVDSLSLYFSDLICFDADDLK